MFQQIHIGGNKLPSNRVGSGLSFCNAQREVAATSDVQEMVMIMVLLLSKMLTSVTSISCVTVKNTTFCKIKIGCVVLENSRATLLSTFRSGRFLVSHFMIHRLPSSYSLFIVCIRSSFSSAVCVYHSLTLQMLRLLYYNTLSYGSKPGSKCQPRSYHFFFSHSALFYETQLLYTQYAATHGCPSRTMAVFIPLQISWGLTFLFISAALRL